MGKVKAATNENEKLTTAYKRVRKTIYQQKFL